MRFFFVAVSSLVLQYASVLGQVSSSSSSTTTLTTPAPVASPTLTPTISSSTGTSASSATSNTNSGSGTTSSSTTGSSATGSSSTSGSSSKTTPPPLPSPQISGPPDVHLSVPELSVKRIELDVDNLSAEINLNANVANLVSVNAGIAVSIRKVNLTIADVGAELELNVRLGHLVDIVNRVFQSLDLNPLLLTAINNVTSVLETAVGAVEGLLGSISQGTSTLNFIIDNLGNIVQQVVGAAGETVSTIVGDFETNMTFTGKQQTLSGGLTQKTYSYSPLNALVNIVFNSLNQVVSAVVVKPDSSKSARGGAGPAGAKPASGTTAAAAAAAAGAGGGRQTITKLADGRPPVAISSSLAFMAD